MEGTTYVWLVTRILWLRAEEMYRCGLAPVCCVCDLGGCALGLNRIRKGPQDGCPADSPQQKPGLGR